MSKLNVEVWEKPVEEDKPVLIRTRKYEDGSIQTFIADESGAQELGATCLYELRPNGCLLRNARIDKGLAARAGIKLDSEGRIKLEEQLT